MKTLRLLRKIQRKFLQSWELRTVLTRITKDVLESLKQPHRFASTHTGCVLSCHKLATPRLNVRTDQWILKISRRVDPRPLPNVRQRGRSAKQRHGKNPSSPCRLVAACCEQ